MDVEAKRNQDGITQWTYDNIPEKLWNIRPLSKFWGIS
ncbi:DNA-damage repair protein [Bacillus pseudomycoides]|nr:DNA-damage repair protein [Bacillus pseudomycoides]EEM10643.1 DNA-damage repair protein [Bacillus pseudomycoides]